MCEDVCLCAFIFSLLSLCHAIKPHSISSSHSTPFCLISFFHRFCRCHPVVVLFFRWYCVLYTFYAFSIYNMFWSFFYVRISSSFPFFHSESHTFPLCHQMEMKLYNHLEFMFIELSYSLIKTSISIKNRSDNIRKGFLVRNFYEHFYALTCVKLCVCV